MNCTLHPATLATATCHACGCGLCSSCSARLAQLRCHHCVAQENATVARTAYRTLAVSVIFFLVGFCLAGVWPAAVPKPGAPKVHSTFPSFSSERLLPPAPAARPAESVKKEREAIHPPADQRQVILLQCIIGLQLAFTYLVYKSLAANIRSRRIVLLATPAFWLLYFVLKPLLALLVGASPFGWIVGPYLLFKLLRQIRIARRTKLELATSS
jgi:hypothetical protein